MRKWILGGVIAKRSRLITTRTLLCGVLLLTTIAWAGDILRPPPRQTLGCLLFGINCRDPLRLIPDDPRPYAVPRSVGAWSQYNDMSEGPLPWWPITTGRPFWETLQRAHDIHDLTAVGFALRAHPTINYYENVRRAFRNPDIDIIVLWTTHWAATEDNCDGGQNVVWQDYPLTIFEDLYRTYAHQNKTIILMTYESDNRLHGMGCREREQCAPWGWYTNGVCEAACEDGTLMGIPEMSEGEPCSVVCCDLSKLSRGRYMIRTFDARQAAVEAAREAHPDAALRVYHAVEIDRYSDDEWLLVARDVLPYLQTPPDFVGLSLWPAKSDPAIESFHRVQDWIGLPAYRFFIAEVGAREQYVGKQYDRLMSVIPPLFDAGVAFALVWSLEQSSENQFTTHALVDQETGEYRSGMAAIEELNETYR